MPEIEPQSLELRAQVRIGDFAPLLVDDRATPRRTPAEGLLRSANEAA